MVQNEYDSKVQDFVTGGFKKRRIDQISKPSADRVNNDVSPIEHVNNYFKKLKRARGHESQTYSSDEEEKYEENWMIKRDDNRYKKDTDEPAADNDEQPQQNKVLEEIDLKFPGFRKGPTYIKLENTCASLL